MKDSDETRLDNRLFAKLGAAPSHDAVEAHARQAARAAEKAQEQSRKNRAVRRKRAARL